MNIDVGELAQDLRHAFNRAEYVESLGFPAFDWQIDVLSSTDKRKGINGCRQSGKSTIIASVPAHGAKFFPKSSHLVLAATEKQAVEDIEKIKDFMSRDPTYPAVVRDSDSLVELANGSRIQVVPATEKAARGFSRPRTIVMDEASRITDQVYTSGVRAMLTDNPDCELIAISTPNGRRGFFYRIITGKRWTRWEVRAPWEVAGSGLVPAAPEKDYRARKAKDGIRAYYSPRHRSKEEQLEHLGEEGMGPLMYRQEILVEFVEPVEQVFGYEEIDRMFNPGRDVAPLFSGREAAPL